MTNIREVAKERTGWRDMELSLRHRRWGWDCPGIDLDFLFLEYDKGKAVAIVEYKHEKAKPQYRTHPSYQAMIDLGDRAGIPVYGCRYAGDFSWFKVTALNDLAVKTMAQNPAELDERGWVTFLHHIRGYEVPDKMFKGSELAI